MEKESHVRDDTQAIQQSANELKKNRGLKTGFSN